MTIEEAVRHCYEVAENNCTECGKEHLQLAEWLRELDRLRLENSALRLAIAAVPEMDWIPCSERLPDLYETVLVAYKGYDGELVYSVSERFRFNGKKGIRWSAIAGNTPSHWMPLPEPPETKEDEYE